MRRKIYDRLLQWKQEKNGTEDGIEMYPMDFEEFLWALGNEVLMPYIHRQFENCKPMGDFQKVDAIKCQILRLYKNDIKKYAGGS